MPYHIFKCLLQFSYGTKVDAQSEAATHVHSEISFLNMNYLVKCSSLPLYSLSLKKGK